MRMGTLARSPCASSEGDQLVDLPLINGGDAIGATQFRGQPLVNVAGGGGTPLVRGPNPTAPRDAGSDGGAVGDQDLSAIGKHDLSHVAGDL